jgi:hypothetical protein
VSQAFDHWRITFADGRVVRVDSDETMHKLVNREAFLGKKEPEVKACGSDDVGPDIDLVGRR